MIRALFSRSHIMATIGMVTLLAAGCATQHAPASNRALSSWHGGNQAQATAPKRKTAKQPTQSQSAGDTPDSLSDQALETPGLLQLKSPKKTTVAKTEPANLWVRIRQGFKLDHNVHQPTVRHWIAFYSSHDRMLQEDFQRAKPFLRRIVQDISEHNMPTELALLPEVESAYNPFARSDASQATGLWQFMPVTAERFGLRHNWWYDGRRNILRSTQAALTYLRYLHQMFHGSWLLALAAYNSGEGTVEHAIERNVRHGQPADFWHLHLPQQTEQYVPQLLALAALVNQPKRYNIDLPDLPNKPQLKEVKLSGPIDISLAAKLAGISTHSLRDLNPGFRRWATDPAGPHQLLLPRHSVKRFKRRLSKVSSHKWVTWRRYVIHRGDTLQQIAQRYATTPSILRHINHLHGSMIRSGHSLLIPVAEKGANARRLAIIAEQSPSHHAHATRVHYRVRSGNSLWGIAHRFGVTVASLRRWNGLGGHSSIRPGQTLTIYRSGSHRGHVTPVRYTVQPGNSLWGIAHRFGVTVASLRHWNRLGSHSHLKPGQSLKILHSAGHVDYRVQKGDSLWTIAHHYNVSVSQLKRWNGLKSAQDLHPGQKLQILLASGSGHGNNRS